MDTILGPLDAPYNLSARNADNGMLYLEWVAPFSLNVTNEPEVLHYTLCTNSSGLEPECRKIEYTCSYPEACNYSMSGIPPSADGTLKLTLFAVNGYGNGANATDYVTFSKGLFSTVYL